MQEVSLSEHLRVSKPLTVLWWWARQWTRDHFAFNFDCERGAVSTRIFAGGRTNIAFNCLDRHVNAGRGNQPCFLWEARAWVAT